MTIRPSAARQVQECIAALSSEAADSREGAIARLMVIGTRAVGALTGLVADERIGSAARTAALRALEGIGGSRSLDAALGVLDHADSEIATAGVSVARTFLKGSYGVAVTDRLAAITLDRTRDRAVRAAALQALSELPGSAMDPLYAALRNDPEPALTALLESPAVSGSVPPTPSELLVSALVRLPDDPALLRHAVATAGSGIAVIDLHRLLERVRDRELNVPKGEQGDWIAVRGSIHMALADRESLLGVYDLREGVETGTHPLPVEFLAALGRVGDASCLEPLAAAFERDGSTDKLWRRHLAEAFHEIVKRLRLTKRSAALKRIEQRFPGILRAV